ncbi:MAG: diguanylate cyclase [Nitrospiraceae bacterium]|nr:diguanylate cyclase [Nitrospiraceae bacterium]
MAMIQQDSARTEAIAKSAASLMSEADVPPTPQNYRVWFEYALGENEDLVADVEERLQRGESFTAAMNAQLYSTYFPGGDGGSSRAEDETQRILKDILGELLSTSGFASDYGEKLEAYAQRLREARRVSDIHSIIGNLVEDTTKMSESSRRLRARLEESTAQAENLRQELQKTKQEALVDALTGLSNRRAFDIKVRETHEEFQRSGSLFCVLMVDVDHFKAFNDNYGHRVGDAVLQVVAAILKETVGNDGYAARYGGEEFVLLIRTPSISQACAMAERARRRFAAKRFKIAKTGKNIGKITASVGVALVKAEDTVASVVERADKALYLAKELGRNSVKSERDLPQA